VLGRRGNRCADHTGPTLDEDGIATHDGLAFTWCVRARLARR
jgi:hypothetical protein